MLSKGWGESIIIGVAGAGQEITTRLSVGHGQSVEGHCLWWRQGSIRRAQIVDWYMDGKINIDDLITHRLSIEDIYQGFELMHAGESIRSVVVY